MCRWEIASSTLFLQAPDYTRGSLRSALTPAKCQTRPGQSGQAVAVATLLFLQGWKLDPERRE